MGISECPFSVTIGSIAGTSVRSSIVVGRRRALAAKSAVAGNCASGGTRVRSIRALAGLGGCRCSQLDALGVLMDACHYPRGQLQSGAAGRAIYARLAAAKCTESTNAVNSACSGSIAGAGNFSKPNSGCGPGFFTPTRNASRRA